MTYVPPWQPAQISLASSEDCRSPECLRACVKQFDAANSLRYTRNQMGLDETFCNVFCWDCTRALECEIPHWCGDRGESLGVGKGRELSAAGMIGWLGMWGAEHGWWLAAGLSEAQPYADKGWPVVVSWLNPHGTSHVAMLLPSAEGQHHIAQAGAMNFYDEPIGLGFGRLPVQCWVHQ